MDNGKEITLYDITQLVWERHRPVFSSVAMVYIKISTSTATRNHHHAAALGVLELCS